MRIMMLWLTDRSSEAILDIVRNGISFSAGRDKGQAKAQQAKAQIGRWVVGDTKIR
jgi:hypothetical protein